MKLHYMDQRSDEWFDIKLGKFSATDFNTMANGKPATIETLCYKKAAEIITGRRADSDSNYNNFHMERGVELENEARFSFEAKKDCVIEEVGFAELNKYVGCSPDGINQSEKYGIEIKCKDNHTHLKVLTHGWDKSYKWQIQGSMWVLDYKSYWFVSYNPNFDDNSTYCELIERDEEMIDKLKESSEKCIKRVEEIIKSVKGL